MIIGVQKEKFFTVNSNVSAYLNEIKRYVVPTSDEEEILFKRYKENNDLEAREELILRNQRFIFSVAKIYARNDSELGDYISEGNIGLIAAFDMYDPTKGVKFMTFAVWYIRRAMNSYMTTTRNIINRSNNTKYGRRIDEIKEKYFVKEGRYPNAEEIIEILNTEYNIKVKNKLDVLDVLMKSISDEVDDDDFIFENNNEFTSKTSSVNSYLKEEDKEYAEEIINSIIKDIPEKERNVIELIYGIKDGNEYSVDAVAEMLNMSSVTINNIKKRVLHKLQREYGNRLAL